jgi:hypothetical protein
MFVGSVLLALSVLFWSCILFFFLFTAVYFILAQTVEMNQFHATVSSTKLMGWEFW